jgi:hypothetical protein
VKESAAFAYMVQISASLPRLVVDFFYILGYNNTCLILLVKNLLLDLETCA